MRLTIGTKLGLGFGSIICLMIFTAFVVYQRVGDIHEGNDRALNVAAPAVQSCYVIRNAVNRSAAALRGYLVLGNDPEDAKRLENDDEESREEIASSIAILRHLADSDVSAFNMAQLSTLEDTLHKLTAGHAQVKEMLTNADAVGAQRRFAEEAEPLCTRIRDSLFSAIQEETQMGASQDHGALVNALERVSGNVAQVVADMRVYLFTARTDAKDVYEARWKQLQASIDAVDSQSAHFSEKGRSTWTTLAASFNEFKQLSTRLIAQGVLSKQRATRFIDDEIVSIRLEVRDQLDELQASVDQLFGRSRGQLTSASLALRNTVIASTLIAVALAIGVAAVVGRRIARAMQQVVALAQRIASGDLTGDALRINSRDEVGDLATSFNSMRAGLRDLTGQITEATENLASSTAEMATSTKQQAAAAKEQATTIQEISSTLAEIRESGTQIEERAKRVSTEAESTANANAVGTQAAQDVNVTVDGIREQVEQVAENIVSLSGRTQAIGDLIATVTDIAEQTNLLALNASIEAVSAGEQGNRFSVVANELKNLADQAKDCTVQVRTILGEIQKGIHASVMLTEEAVKRVETGKKKSEATEASIRRMADTTLSCVNAFQQIAGGTNQQQIGVTQVTQGMDGIRQAVQQTASGTAQLEKAASNLSALSHQLQSAVRRYKL